MCVVSSVREHPDQHGGDHAEQQERRAGQLGARAVVSLTHTDTTAGAVALLVFFAFAMQCFSTLAIVRRETGSWKWPVFQFSYMFVLAYSGSWVAYHLTNLLLR